MAAQNCLGLFNLIFHLSIMVCLNLIFYFFFTQFSHDSAYPKLNPRDTLRQFITCAAENYILVWGLKRPPSESGVLIQEDEDVRFSLTVGPLINIGHNATRSPNLNRFGTCPKERSKFDSKDKQQAL